MADNSNEGLLLQELMNLAPQLAATANTVLSPIATTRANLRQKLYDEGWILPIPSGTDYPKPASMCAIDGARVTERMYGADLLVAVATSAEALYAEHTEPTLSVVWADIAPHTTELDRVVGAAMAALELTVAHDSQHEIRLLDGSYLTSILEFMKGVGASSADVRNRITSIITTYHTPEHLSGVLTYNSQRPILALPKSESNNFYGRMFEEKYGMTIPVSDRILATQILDAGEILRPRALLEWGHVDVQESSSANKATQKAADAIREAIKPFQNAVRNETALTCYYKQTNASNVLRFEYQTETPEQAIPMAYKYATLLGHETNAPHMLEPMAQWAVDRKAKAISVGTKALRASMLNNLTPEQAATWGRYLAEDYRTSH